MMPAAKVPQPNRRRIYLLRHGDVRYFDDDRRPVPPDTVALTEEGRWQAGMLCQELKDVRLDRVVCSDLPRCVETARLVAGARTTTIEQTSVLREIQPGKLRDLDPLQAEREFLGAFRERLNRDSRFLGGESYGSLWDRVESWLRPFLADASWRQAMIVAHGGVNRVILALALRGDLEFLAALEQDPCCLNVLDVDDAGRFIIRLMNHTPWSPAKIGLELTTMEKLLAIFRGG